MALRRLGYCLASQSRATTRSRVPTAMAKAHKFSASHVAFFPNVLKSQETIEPMITGRAASALPAKLARARPRACRCIFTHSFAGQRKHKGRDRHADCCENRCDSNSLLTKQGTNALSQCDVFMEEPLECLTDSVDLRPEGCSVRGEGFEPCLSFKLDVRDYTLELSDSVSNLSAFQCRLFPSVFHAPARVVFRPRIFGRRYSSALPGCLPTHLSLPSFPFRAQPALFRPG